MKNTPYKKKKYDGISVIKFYVLIINKVITHLYIYTPICIKF